VLGIHLFIFVVLKRGVYEVHDHAREFDVKPLLKDFETSVTRPKVFVDNPTLEFYVEDQVEKVPKDFGLLSIIGVL
jgi:hypothetical protein